MIGLIDVDSTLPNFALMKISAYFKNQGKHVEFVHQHTGYEKIYASSIYTRSRPQCEELLNIYGNRIEIGGSGWDINKRLPPEIESCSPDYSLYSADMIAGRIKGIMTAKTRLQKARQIVDAGMGFTSRGCVRRCPFVLCRRRKAGFVRIKRYGILSIQNPM